MDEFFNDVKKFWESRSQKDQFLWRNNLTKLNAEFLLRIIKPNSKLLDLGAGDCGVDILIADYVKEITAVDYVPIIKTVQHPKIIPIQSDIIEYVDTATYDHIIIFGVMNFIENPERLYQFCMEHLNCDGSLIVKHQCGIDQDVFVDANIDGDRYRSIYRHWEKEVNSLKSIGFTVEVVDPYPPEFNTHKNTGFKGFICKM